MRIRRVARSRTFPLLISPATNRTDPTLLVLAGPTGVGKSATAIECARILSGEIINFDSVQVYRGFDIGSAKPLESDRSSVPHHLYDIVEADEPFDAAQHSSLADRVIEEIRGRGNVPIIVGGTNFYIRALLKGLPDLPGRNEVTRLRLEKTLSRPRGRETLYRWLGRVDPTTAGKISANDTHRLLRALEVWMETRRPISDWRRPGPDDRDRYTNLTIGLIREPAQLRKYLRERVDRMYEAGLVSETAQLLERYDRRARPFHSIGYRETVEHLLDDLPLADAIERTKVRTWQFARRQLSWLRGERDVHIVEPAQEPGATATLICDEYRRRNHQE